MFRLQACVFSNTTLQANLWSLDTLLLSRPSIVLVWWSSISGQETVMSVYARWDINLYADPYALPVGVKVSGAGLARKEVRACQSNSGASCVCCWLWPGPYALGTQDDHLPYKWHPVNSK